MCKRTTFWPSVVPTGRLLRGCVLFVSAIALLVGGCAKSTSVNEDGSKKLTVGIAFESLQTEYWVAGFEAIKDELEKRDIEILEAISDQDPNRQLQQIKSFVTRGVDGIVMVPIDAKSCIPAIRAANKADIPIALFNRPRRRE